MGGRHKDTYHVQFIWQRVRLWWECVARWWDAFTKVTWQRVGQPLHLFFASIQGYLFEENVQHHSDVAQGGAQTSATKDSELNTVLQHSIAKQGRLRLRAVPVPIRLKIEDNNIFRKLKTYQHFRLCLGKACLPVPHRQGTRPCHQVARPYSPDFSVLHPQAPSLFIILN